MRTSPNGPRAAWIDGRAVEAEAARVSVFDSAWRSGLGVFESFVVTRCREEDSEEDRDEGGDEDRRCGGALDCRGVSRNVAAHAARLEDACVDLGFAAPPRVDLGQVLCDLLERCELVRGRARVSFHPTSEEARFVVLLEDVGDLDERRRRGVSLATSPFAFGSRDPSPRCKLEARGLYAAAHARAHAEGAEEALLVDEDGSLRETTRHNIFVRIGDAPWRTPPLEGSCLPGVARAFLLKALSEGAQGAVEERAIDRAELFAAQASGRNCAILLSNGVVGLEPARSLDGQALAQIEDFRPELDRCLQLLRRQGMPC